MAYTKAKTDIMIETDGNLGKAALSNPFNCQIFTVQSDDPDAK